MQKVKTFFHIFKNSALPQAPYYHKLLKTPFSLSIKYFIYLVFIVNLIFSALLFIRLQSSGMLSLVTEIPISLESFPKDLSVTVQNGMLHTNSDKPYFYWLDFGKTKRLVAVVDESATPEKIKRYNSLVLFTAENAVVKRNGSFEKIQYGNRKLTFDKLYVEALRQNIKQLFSLGVALAPILLIVVAPLLFSVLYTIYFLIVTLIIYIPFKSYRRKVTFGKSFQLTLHSSTLPIIIDYSLCLFKPSIAFVPLIHFVFFGLSLLFVFGGIYEAYLDPVTRVHHTT